MTFRPCGDSCGLFVRMRARTPPAQACLRLLLTSGAQPPPDACCTLRIVMRYDARERGARIAWVRGQVAQQAASRFGIEFDVARMSFGSSTTSS